MRKKLAALCAVLGLVFASWGCGSVQLPEGLIGNWTCEDFASDGETATDFYAMYINEDGSFSLYDTVGNPGIAGKMASLKSQKSDEMKGMVKISCDTDDFDPPSCWKMTEMDELEYEILGNGKIRLGHNNIWLYFYDETIHNVYEISLADRSGPEYKWEMSQHGKGRVKLQTDTLPDEDVGVWKIYDFTGTAPGNLKVEMRYTNGDNVMYTVTFDLTVNEDGTIRENEVAGDVDDAMTE